jgi:pimeloyl-ACP methyl ester carboxylesterase
VRPGQVADAVEHHGPLGGVGLDPSPDVQALQDAAAGAPPLPTLYLHGRTDGCMGADLAAAAGAALISPGSRAEIVDDAGHFLHLEQPEVVNRMIADFLAEG